MKNWRLLSTGMDSLVRFPKFKFGRQCWWVVLVILTLAAQAAVCEEDDTGSKDSSVTTENRRTPASDEGQQRELGFEGGGSVGHFHIFANSWWSNLYLGGVGYYRHSWGHAIGARLDYTGAVTAVVLRQPANASFWGTISFHPAAPREYVGGVNIAPIGIRMQWLSDRAVRPYLLGRGGIMGTTKKALSVDGSYMNWSLQVGTGVQFRISQRWDGTVGWQFFHFSNGFIVPSNPGLDSMMYTCGLNYHLAPRSRR
jgi:opacity protein-like surface antigen